MKARLKHVATRMMRPGLLEANAQLHRLEDSLADVRSLAKKASELNTRRFGLWRGGMSGEAVDTEGRPMPELTAKYLDELTFWNKFIKHDSKATMPDGFERVYGGWQRDRMKELGDFLGLAGADELNTWCHERSAVEIGAGPYPSIATHSWKRAVAIDPLADGYTAEGLLPVDCYCDEVVYLASPGESVPLPTAFADVVVIENCLDHVDSPHGVLKEIFRLLKPGGLLWLLVDLMDYRDHMHPNPFSESKLRDMLLTEGFGVLRDRVSDHKSHPQAYGEYRGLLIRRELAPAPTPEVVVTPHARAAIASAHG